MGEARVQVRSRVRDYFCHLGIQVSANDVGQDGGEGGGEKWILDTF